MRMIATSAAMISIAVKGSIVCSFYLGFRPTQIIAHFPRVVNQQLA